MVDDKKAEEARVYTLQGVKSNKVSRVLPLKLSDNLSPCHARSGWKYNPDVSPITDVQGNGRLWSKWSAESFRNGLD